MSDAGSDEKTTLSEFGSDFDNLVESLDGLEISSQEDKKPAKYPVKPEKKPVFHKTPIQKPLDITVPVEGMEVTMRSWHSPPSSPAASSAARAFGSYFRGHRGSKTNPYYQNVDLEFSERNGDFGLITFNFFQI